MKTIAKSSSHINRRNKMICAIAIGTTTYHKNYLLKTPCRMMPYSGWAALLSMINGLFFNLCKTLIDNYGLKPTRSVTVEEQVATFFMIVGTLEGNRQLFQDPNETTSYIKDNPRYYPYFKVTKASPTFYVYCIGAVDVTHIMASIPTPHQRFLALYKGQRYQLTDFERVSYYNNHFGTFNHIHSYIRTTIERTFGYQVALVPATMAIHNFIRKNDRYDEDFLDFERESEQTEPHDDPHILNAQRHGPEIEQGGQQMDRLREDICIVINFSRIGIPI
ncbi:hypothetical protein ACJIZ3_011268 [Penstemon smallii]|uniref:DUF8040 domain-containing protein n=1 Tax=Penstemon smallii TaxID=265156 RepID=A0ABD3UKB8_9LAMI